MIHILLLILKIIGIVLLAVLILALLLLFFPIIYVGKVEAEDGNLNGGAAAYWLFHVIHFSVKFHGSNVKYALRVFGIPVFSSKKKDSRDKKEKKYIAGKPEYKENKRNPDRSAESTHKVKNDDVQQILHTKENYISDHGKINDNQGKERQAENKERVKARISRKVKKIKNILKDSVNDTKSAYNQLKQIKTFITANTTKEAYHYGKRLIIKFVRHIFPKKIRANINFGFDEPHITGQVLGYIAMAFGTLGINPEKIVVEPDFEKSVFKAKAKCKGYVLLGVAGIYILKFYFKKEIHEIIKKFS